jgi:hypothetical protein
MKFGPAGLESKGHLAGSDATRHPAGSRRTVGSKTRGQQETANN